jgi:spore coat protein CotF
MPQNANGQIANPVPSHQQQQKGPEMNDRDRVNDILATEKYLTDSFNISAREASHDQLHQDIMKILTETHQAARDMYNLMFQYGWYKLEAEQQQKIDQAHQQFQGYSTQFPYPSVQ